MPGCLVMMPNELKLPLLSVCSKELITYTALKLADITHAVEEELNSSCPCPITRGIIDGVSFACSEASPNSVTY